MDTLTCFTCVVLTLMQEKVHEQNYYRSENIYSLGLISIWLANTSERLLITNPFTCLCCRSDEKASAQTLLLWQVWGQLKTSAHLSRSLLPASSITGSNTCACAEPNKLNCAQIQFQEKNTCNLICKYRYEF